MPTISCRRPFPPALPSSPAPNAPHRSMWPT
uniref:Uncharacterized protein n=1 Tax=Siphoviridae sp. ctmP19 TaxID=2825651 RepID=A0A8S5PJ22_9CAUD|nr:MAG TPA: hypothetical protein [Siphoviridae sp. ctmP19]